MTATANFPSSLLSSLLTPVEHHILTRRCSNVLIVGDVSSTEAMLRALAPWWTDPLTLWQPGCDFRLPSLGGTLVVRDVSNLTGLEQAALFGWLDQNHRARVVSTSPRSLIPLLERGTFSTALYYRLNMVYIELPDA